MITAEEARTKIFTDVVKEESTVSLINRINSEIERAVKHNQLNVKIFFYYRISDYTIVEALKWYYKNLGYGFNFSPNYKDDVCTIEIIWRIEED